MTKYAVVLSFLLAACGDDGNNPDIPAQNRAVIVSGDFNPGAPGVMSALDLETVQMDQRVAPNGAVGDDPVLRRVGGELFVVNRNDGNNVTILDAITFTLVDQFATGAGSNPQDIAVIGDQLYVPATGTAGVVAIDRVSGESRLIDLSFLDTVDGLPDCVSAFAVGKKVFVACGMLDNFVAHGPGKVVVIDSDNEAGNVLVIDMLNENPFGLFERMPTSAGGDLVIPTVPDFSDFSTGCVERFSTSGSPVGLGCGATNAQLGGFAARIAFQEIDGELIQWMVASSFDTAPRGNLQGFSVGTGALIGAPISPGTQVLVDVATCPDNSIVVADATLATNGLRLYANDAEVTTTPLAVGLKPGSPHGLTCY